MRKFTAANRFILSRESRRIQPGEVVELTDAEAKRLEGRNVLGAEIKDPVPKETATVKPKETAVKKPAAKRSATKKK